MSLRHFPLRLPRLPRRGLQGYGLGVTGYGLWVGGYGLWVMGYGLWVMGLILPS